MSMRNYKMPERDYESLKLMIGWDNDDFGDLPDELVEIYWHHRAMYMRSFTGASLDDSPMWMLHQAAFWWQIGGKIMQTRAVHLPPKPFSKVVEKLERGELIEVWWRNGWRTAELQEFYATRKELSALWTDPKWRTSGPREFAYDECREHVVVPEDIKQPEPVEA